TRALLPLPRPASTLFPYTTLFRSFRHLAHRFDGTTITLSDYGFRKRNEEPRNLKFCFHKSWGERMLVETMLSMVTRVCRLKHLRSEEHTSELQSRENLVCRLLLAK